MPSPTQLEGKRQEDHAEALLLREGYRIVTRNWRGARGEIDVVARDRGVLVFVEVRSRRSVSYGRPAATVGRAKQRLVARAALAYLARFPRASSGGVRFDVIEVVVDRQGCPIDLVLVKNAFDARELHRGPGAPMF